MAKFGKKSKSKLVDADPRIQEILNKAIEFYDFTILETHRTNERQDELYKAGKSKVKAGKSKHNTFPSKAVDIAPYPIDWNDLNRFVYLAGIIEAVSFELGYKIRWGGNWDMDGKIINDQSFDDLPHFEII